MYFNRLLFPAPNRRYKANQFENELFFVTRERYPKNFVIDRRESLKSPKSPEKNSPSPPTKPRFYRFFRGPKLRPQEPTLKQPSISIYMEASSVNKSGLHDASNSPEKCEDHEPNSDLPSFLRVSSLRKQDRYLATGRDSFGSKIAEDSGKERRKSEEKYGKKKDRKTCWSFLPKIHKDKKIMDEENGPIPFDFNLSPDMVDFKVELEKVSSSPNQNHAEVEKESSSDSEDDAATQGKKFVQIPCLYIKARIVTNKTLMYFHANGEDLSTSYEFLKSLSCNLMVNVVAIEYPGYGVYAGSPSEKKVLIDAEVVYDHLVNNFRIKEEDILIFGRSIGSGPATWLASVKKPGMLILMSPFTSVKAMAKHLGGRIAKFLVKQRFKNIEFMAEVKCPVFIVHGKRDTTIPYSQASELFEVIKGKKKLYLAEDMTHCQFDFLLDISVPLTQWLKELNLFNFEPSLHDISYYENTQLNVENIALNKRVSLRLREKKFSGVV